MPTRQRPRFACALAAPSHIATARTAFAVAARAPQCALLARREEHLSEHLFAARIREQWDAAARRLPLPDYLPFGSGTNDENPEVPVATGLYPRCALAVDRAHARAVHNATGVWPPHMYATSGVDMPEKAEEESIKCTVTSVS